MKTRATLLICDPFRRPPAYFVKFLIDECLSPELSSNARKRVKSANIFREKERRVTNAFEKQLQAVIIEYESALARAKYDDVSDTLSRTTVVDIATRCVAAIERIAGRGSAYFRQIEQIRKRPVHEWTDAANMIGIAKALLSDIQNDYLRSFEEILHGDLFGDFLEMSTHLADQGYKDAAAVLAGSTLEVHLKKLCDKHGITTISGQHTKKADTLNAELVKVGAYTKLNQKSVTAWLGLRNNAAHGNYSEYTVDQVKLLVASIREFITRCPA